MSEESVCPYGDKECPKLKEHEEYAKKLERKIDIAIALIIAFHGTEIIAVLTAL